MADAKRGDIGTTAARQAAALYDVLGADAVTVNPYLGEEAVAPLLERGDRFAYVLCRTSNPGAAELQGLEVAADDAAGLPAEPLWARVARRVDGVGPGRDRRARRRRHRPRRDGRRSGRSRRGSRSSSRASGRRAARSRRCSRTAPRPRRRRAGGPAAACSSTSPGAIARAALDEPESGARGDPGERLAQAAAEWAARLAVLP